MKNKIYIAIVIIAIGQIGCGRSTVNSELIGQVKKVQNHTPLLCPEYVTADISLGVMNGGSGSVSTNDVWVVVPQKDVATFQQAVESSRLVKVHYDTWRVAPCSEDDWADSIQFLDGK